MEQVPQSELKEKILSLVEQSAQPPAHLVEQITEDKELVATCIRELLEDGDLKSNNGILSI